MTSPTSGPEPQATPLTTPTQEASLRALGYPKRPGYAEPPKDAPAAILRRQERCLKAYQHLATFQRAVSRGVRVERMPVSPERVAAWVGERPERARLSAGVAADLAYLDTFRKETR